MADDPKQLPTGVSELLAQSGYAAIPLRDLADSARFAAQLKWLETSFKETIRSQFAEVVEIVTAMSKEQAEHRAKLDQTLVAHAKRLDSHDELHTQHKREITGVHRRLLLVEETITQPLSPLKVPRAKPRRKKKK